MSDGNFGRELLESGALMKRGFAYLAKSSGKVVAVITAIVAVLVTFTDIALTNFGTAAFTTTLLVMLIASYLIYFSLEDAGERLGKESEEYSSARQSYVAVRGRILPEHIASLREYLADYAAAELDYRRRNYLCREGYSPEDYAAYKRGASVSRRALRTFRRAERMRAVSLSPTMLLSREGVGGRELVNPELSRRVYSLLKLLPSTVCMFFTASVILTAKPNLTASVIIEGILKLSALPIVGFRGYSSGYFYALGAGCLWLETKTRLLLGFLEKFELANQDCYEVNRAE